MFTPVRPSPASAAVRLQIDCANRTRQSTSVFPCAPVAAQLAVSPGATVGTLRTVVASTVDPTWVTKSTTIWNRLGSLAEILHCPVEHPTRRRLPAWGRGNVRAGVVGQVERDARAWRGNRRRRRRCGRSRRCARTAGDDQRTAHQERERQAACDGLNSHSSSRRRSTVQRACLGDHLCRTLSRAAPPRLNQTRWTAPTATGFGACISLDAAPKGATRQPETWSADSRTGGRFTPG